jgi:hypothetical protein
MVEMVEVIEVCWCVVKTGERSDLNTHCSDYGCLISLL